MNSTGIQVSLILLVVVMLSPTVAALPTVSTHYASNWSGYVATSPGPYTLVSASWIVPSVSVLSPPTYSSVWIGVGGWYRNSNRLIQIGTDQDVLNNGTAVYYAWREVFPGLAIPVASLSPGDSITAAVSQISANASTWHMLIVRNSATLLNITIRARVNLASEDTADFIVERPAIGRRNQLTTLANFKNVTFSGCTTNQGALISIKSVAMVVMKVGNATNVSEYLAQPTALDQLTNGFSVLYSGSTQPIAEFPSYLTVIVVILMSNLWVSKSISTHKLRRTKREHNLNRRCLTCLTVFHDEFM
jgi:hypothetical protein